MTDEEGTRRERDDARAEARERIVDAVRQRVAAGSAIVASLNDARAVIEALDEARSLPVLRTCRDCASSSPTSGGYCCDHTPPHIGGPHIDIDDTPPSWCPLRGSVP